MKSCYTLIKVNDLEFKYQGDHMATQVHVYFYLHLIYNKSPSFENYNKNTNQFYLIQHFIIVSLKYEHTISIKGKTNSLQYKELKYFSREPPEISGTK